MSVSCLGCAICRAFRLTHPSAGFSGVLRVEVRNSVALRAVAGRTGLQPVGMRDQPHAVIYRALHFWTLEELSVAVTQASPPASAQNSCEHVPAFRRTIRTRTLRPNAASGQTTKCP